MEGTATVRGVTVPVRLTRSGLDMASLSMTSVPVSVLKGADEDEPETWLRGE